MSEPTTEDQDIQTALSAQSILKHVVPDVFEDVKISSSQFIDKYWHLYKKNYESNPSLNGKVFEGLIGMALCRAGIFPIYMQARAAFIRSVNYDFIIYTEEFGPISLSAKTTLRERWKQADLEALALKNIHRQSKSYLITLDVVAAATRNTHLEDVMAIEKFIVADTPDFDQLIETIKNLTVIEAPEVHTISSNFVLNVDNFKTYFQQ